MDGSEDIYEEQQGSAPEDEGRRDAVLVTDADSATAEQVVLQLIMARFGAVLACYVRRGVPSNTESLYRSCLHLCWVKCTEHVETGDLF